MQDQEFDNWLRASARSYNEPPVPDVEGMWAAIEQEQLNKSVPNIAPHTTPAAAPFTPVTPLRSPWYNSGLMRVAAALVIGVGLGRVSLPATSANSGTPSTVAVANATAANTALEQVVNSPEASQYMGKTIALLASLQSSSRTATQDKQLVSGAADLLNTTRFLLDSPTTNNSNVRGLLEDLELVLAQIVQLTNTGTAGDVDMIHQAMEQRDVMPRLRTAVANNYSAD